jgi:hypothetical protein
MMAWLSESVVAEDRPDHQIRRFLCRHPGSFRSVRDLGLVPARCSDQSGISESRSSRWLPAWLPASEGLPDGFACRGPSAFQAGHIPKSARIVRALSAVADSCCPPLAAAVAVTVAVSRDQESGLWRLILLAVPYLAGRPSRPPAVGVELARSSPQPDCCRTPGRMGSVKAVFACT